MTVFIGVEKSGMAFWKARGGIASRVQAV